MFNLLTARPQGTLVTLVVALIASSCSDGSEAGDGTVRQEKAGAFQEERGIRDLIAATKPLEASASTQETSRWIKRREEMLTRLRAGGPDVGREALSVFAAGLHEEPDVQQALLDVAAHTVPEEAVPILEKLVTTYGPHPDVRGGAALLLAEADPDAAVRLLEPVVLDAHADKTLPARETLLEACLVASRATEHDTAEFLSRVAIDIYQLDSVRHRAVRELGSESGLRVERTLEEILTESTGNAYLRRLAAQALIGSMDVADLCPILLRVADRESDERFLVFLQDALNRNCP